MDETSRPVVDTPADELAHKDDTRRDDSVDQHIDKGADQASTTKSDEG